MSMRVSYRRRYAISLMTPNLVGRPDRGDLAEILLLSVSRVVVIPRAG